MKILKCYNTDLEDEFVISSVNQKKVKKKKIKFLVTTFKMQFRVGNSSLRSFLKFIHFSCFHFTTNKKKRLIKLFYNPNCSKCKKALSFIQKQCGGDEFEIHIKDYLKDPPSLNELQVVFVQSYPSKVSKFRRLIKVSKNF